MRAIPELIFAFAWLGPSSGLVVAGLKALSCTARLQLGAHGMSMERHWCSILAVGHSRKIVTWINVSCPAEEEFLESSESTRPERIRDTSKTNAQRKALRSCDRDQFEMIG